MSAESSQWLNLNTLIGFTDKRGKAWHYREAHQGAETNHYPGAIPVEDVRRRLFHWQPITTALRATAELLTEDGVTLIDICDNTRQVLIRPDTQTVLGVFSDGYKIHDYQEWLIENVYAITDTELHVASAGLLKGGAQAWVQFEYPDTEEYAGFAFRPFVTAFTSLNGSLASGYTTGIQAVVCDNTLSANVSDAKREGTIAKRRHTKNSLDNISDIREALKIELPKVSQDFQHQVDVLTAVKVTDAVWSAFIETHMPIAETVSPKGKTTTENRRAALTGLWNNDTRVTPWKGTAFGVLQAVNTYEHHLSKISGVERAEKNMTRVVRQEHHELDRGTIATLNRVFSVKGQKQISFV